MVDSPKAATSAITTHDQPNEPVASLSTTGGLYATPNEALKAVREDFLYWTGRLTETSLQLSYALIAANWAVFGSVEKLLNNLWAKLSIILVVIGLGLSVAGAKWMSELHRERIDYAETNESRWCREYERSRGERLPWPFTRKIEVGAQFLRGAKTWLPLAAGVSFFIALLSR